MRFWKRSSENSGGVRLQDDPDHDLKVRIAHDIRTDAALLKSIALQATPSLLAVVVSHPRADERLLDFGAESRYPHVVWAVAHHPRISAKTAEWLWRHRPSRIVAGALYRNPATPPHVLVEIDALYHFSKKWVYSFQGDIFTLNDAQEINAGYLDWPPSGADLRVIAEALMNDRPVPGDYRDAGRTCIVHLSRAIDTEEALALIDTVQKMPCQDPRFKMKVVGVIFSQPTIDHDQLFSESDTLREWLASFVSPEWASHLYSLAPYVPYEMLVRAAGEARFDAVCRPPLQQNAIHLQPLRCVGDGQKWGYRHLPRYEFNEMAGWQAIAHPNCPDEIRIRVLSSSAFKNALADQKTIHEIITRLAMMLRFTGNEEVIKTVIDEVARREPSMAAELLSGVVRDHPSLSANAITAMMATLPEKERRRLEYDIRFRALHGLGDPGDFNRAVREGRVPLTIAVEHPATEPRSLDAMMRQGLAQCEREGIENFVMTHKTMPDRIALDHLLSGGDTRDRKTGDDSPAAPPTRIRHPESERGI